MNFIRPRVFWPATPTIVPTRFTGRRWHAIQTLQAAAELARNRLLRHWYISALTAAELEEVKSLIDRALTLAAIWPGSALVAVRGLLYYGHRQYEKALTEFNRTLVAAQQCFASTV